MKTIETRYRDKMDVVINYDVEHVVDTVGVDTLVLYYIKNHAAARKCGGIADKKDAPAELELNYVEGGDEIAIYADGSRAGAPTKLDNERAEALYALPDNELEARLEKWKELVNHEVDVEALNDADEPEKVLAKLARRVRLKIEAKKKALEADEFGA